MKNQTKKATRARNARPPITPPATGPAMLLSFRGLGVGVAVSVTVIREPEDEVVEEVELLLLVTVTSRYGELDCVLEDYLYLT